MSDTLMISVSGVRGLVGTDLTPELVARWAAAFGVWGKGNGGRGKRKARIVLGRDARTSGDRKSTRLNSSHSQISYAVFCLKKKNNTSIPVRHSSDISRCSHLSPSHVCKS